MCKRDEDPREVLRRWFSFATEEGQSDSILQQRAVARTPWPVPIEVRTSRGERLHGRIRDVTETGVGIQCRSRISDWSEVRIRRQDQPDEFVDGVVVHCTETVGGYKIGVRVVPR